MRALIALLLIGGAAAADEDCWRVTFGAEAAASWLDDSRPAVLVAGGDGAGGALAAALRASGRARLVLDAREIGLAADGSDRDVVGRAAALPVDLVAVVRTYRDAAGPERAVITLYDRQLHSLAAFAAACGSALGPRASASAPGARDQYQQRFVGFAKVAVLHVETDGETVTARQAPGRWGAPYLGQQQLALAPFDFYNTVDRPDLAGEYRRLQRRRQLLFGPGAAAVVLGAALAAGGIAFGWTQPFCRAQDLAGACIDTDHPPSWPLIGVGIALVTAGAVALIAGLVARSSPTSEVEDHRLAAAHNRRLRARLGLPDAPDDAVPDEAEHPPVISQVPGELVPSLKPPPPPEPKRTGPASGL